jgi:glycerophosphoryl diester phosphodiesterase
MRKNTRAKSITCGILGWMILVIAGCSVVFPEAEGHSGAGDVSARISGLAPKDTDTFLDDTYGAALRTSRIQGSERQIIAGSLQRTVEPPQKMLVFGHRGASSFYPENTLSAVKAAWADVDGAEIDIQLTRDNIAVVLHDDTLRRTAEVWPENSAVGEKYFDTPVGALDWADIKNVAIGPRGEKIPTLGSIFEELSRHPDKKLLVEIKSYDQSDKALQKRMILALDQSIAAFPKKNRHQVMLISFDQEVLRASKNARHLKDFARYWLLTGAQIEEAHSRGGLQDLLKIADEFTGLDIESGPYLYKKIMEGKNIVQLIRGKDRDVIVWISRRQRTDGAHWLNVSKSLGVNIFTSDLPLDLLVPSRKPMRAKQAVEILKKAGVSASLRKDGSGVDSQLLIGDKKFAFYAPSWSDFRNSPGEDLAQAIKKDISYLSDLVDGVVVSLADLTSTEQNVFMNALRSLPPPLKQTLKVVKPDLSSKVHDRSVIDVPSAKSRLRELNAVKGTLIQI